MSIVGILLLLNLLFISTNGLRMTFQETLDEPTAPSTQQNYADLKWAQLEFLNEPPEKRRGHTTIVLGSELLVFGGCYLDQKCFNDLHSFDTRTKVWTSQRINGIPPSQREGHSVAVVGSKMYLFGGSGSSSYYNDLFIFDLESKTWLEVNYQGPKPTPRSNHGAVVDKKGRIIIFGGFTENGYSNDIFIMDPAEEKWEKPFVSGQAPVPRENFSITRVRNTIWIFGGFTDGGVLGDLNILDLDSMAWNAVETFGTKPPGRQGHGAIVHEKNFMMFGGCNYKIKDCYSDMYYLDIDSLWWKKISDDKTEKFKPRESFSTNVIGAMIYVFGGCKLYEECYNDVLAYNTNIPCPNSCSNNGECRNEQCVCSQGYFDNDCSLSIKCKDDCNGHGECRSNGKCACFSGFTGESCDTTVNCPNNCTSSDRGICLSTGQCKCFSGFSGDSCESGTAVAMACPKDCSRHGECDKRTGICVCEKFYTGDDCSKSIDDIQLADAKLGVKAQELAEQNMIDSATTIEQVREEIQEQIAAQRIEEEEKLHEGEGTDGLKALEEKKADEDEDEFLDEGEEDLGYGGPLESGSQEIPPQEPSAETGTTEGVTSESSETTETAETAETTETQEDSETSEENAEEELGEYGLEEELESLMQRAAREGKISESSSEGLVTIGEQPSSIALLDASLQQSTTTGSSSGSANTTNASDTTRNSLEEQLRGGGVQRTTTQTTTETETDDEQFENTAVENLTPEMFADAYSKERKLQQKKILATDAESSMCPNSCSHNGLCRGDTCYCSNGYTGEDCSISNVQDLKEGETVEKLLKYAGACFVIGAVIGIFLIVALIRKAQESEYMNIQPKVEEED